MTSKVRNMLRNVTAGRVTTGVLAPVGGQPGVTASYGSCLVLVALVLGLAGMSRREHPKPEPTPVTIPTGIERLTPEPTPVLAGFDRALELSLFTPSERPIIRAIAVCESGLDERAVGDHGRSLGALQIHVPAHPDLAATYDLMTYEGSLAAAREVYEKEGWGAWSCAR